MDASNLLKPALAKNGLRFVGSTTYKEFRGIFEIDFKGEVYNRVLKVIKN